MSDEAPNRNGHEHTPENEPVCIRDAARSAMEGIALRAEAGGKLVTGLETGLLDLDDLTSGFQPGQLIVVAGRPSMGKSSLVLNICDHIGINLGVPLLFVSQAMGEKEISERIICARSRVDGHKLRTGLGLGMRELTQLSKALKQITEKGNIFIDCGRSRTINWIAETARSSHRKRKIGILVVDFIPTMDSNELADGRADHLAGSVRRLKTIALDLQIPVIAVAQASRDLERRRDKRPRLGDLTESDAIESIADIVLFVHRPEYYDVEDAPGVAEIILAKNRDGPTGSIRLAFLKDLMRFENLAATHDPLGDDVPF